MKFTDFIGNEKIKEQIAFLYQTDRIPHAIVIEGDEGLGKRTFAREFVLNLFCKSDEDEPCRKCAQCVKVLKRVHPDIYEYSAPGAPNSFHVDVVREIIDDVYIQPNEADYKVYILANCQCMNASAQNALLKVLEEPPAYAIFILCVTNKSALLATVLSRSVVFSLQGVEPSAAADYIAKNYEEYDLTEIQNSTAVWNGNIGKALQSLSDGKLREISDIACEMAQALTMDNEYELLKVCSKFERDREMLTGALGLLKMILRDALVGHDVVSGQAQTAKLLSSRLTKKKLLSLISACDNIKTAAERTGNITILITKICYELRRAQGR